jgi:hypothetical protein
MPVSQVIGQLVGDLTAAWRVAVQLPEGLIPVWAVVVQLAARMQALNYSEGLLLVSGPVAQGEKRVGLSWEDQLKRVRPSEEKNPSCPFSLAGAKASPMQFGRESADSHPNRPDRREQLLRAVDLA